MVFWVIFFQSATAYSLQNWATGLVPGSHVVFFTVIQSAVTVLLEMFLLWVGYNPPNPAHPGERVFSMPGWVGLLGLLPLTGALMLITWDGNREKRLVREEDRLSHQRSFAANGGSRGDHVGEGVRRGHEHDP